MKQDACIRALALFLLVPCCRLFGGAKQTLSQGENMLNRSRELSDVRCQGCPPFLLRAKVRFFKERDKAPLEGSFEEHWQAATRWRTNTQFQTFFLIRIGRDNRIWSYGDSVYEAYSIRILSEALGANHDPRPGSESKVEKNIEKKIEGKRCPCVVTSAQWNAKRTVCFEASSGARLTQRIDLHGVQETIQYSDYAPFHDKLFPRLLRFSLNEKLLLEVRVADLAPEPNASPYLFEPPVEAVSWPTCSDMKQPKPIEIPEPTYSEQARNRRAEGKVVVYIVVGIDGRVYNPSLLNADDRELARLAEDTITQRWRFQPASCGDSPVPSSVLVETSFRLF